MKYLKLYENFNFDIESDNELKQKFIDITDNYLSFLKDDGLVIGVSRLEYPNIDSLPAHIKDSYEKVKHVLLNARPHVYVSLQFYPNGKQPVNKTWGEVKDEILAYLEYVNNNYRFRTAPGTAFSERKCIELNLKDDNDVRTTLKVSISEIMSPDFDNQKFNRVNIDDCYPTTLRTRVYI